MCPDENTLAGYLQGLLPPSDVREVERHLDTCPTCREVMSELGRVVGAISDGNELGLQDTVLAEAGPRRVGRYEIEGIVGRGGMGEVLAALDPVLHRRVAVKLIRPELWGGGDTQREATERLVREARAMATLAHPNVVPVFDAGLVDGQVFLAMEYVEGTTLAEWLATAPPWEAVLERFLEAGRGLAAAHHAGILHRDFKPHNVLIGRDGRVRVTDFGLARPLEEPGLGAAPLPRADSTPSLTRLGEVLGTPAFMSPEQLFGQPVDARSDVFSFCVALYEALLGARPYDAPTLDGMRQRMIHGRMQTMPNLQGIPSALIRTLQQGLAISPLDRPQSMDALLAELERSRGGEQHVRIHLVCQALFSLCHVVGASWFSYGAFIAPSAARSTSTGGSSGGSSGSSGLDVVAIFVLFWGIALFAFLYGGIFWAAVNALGLRGRRRWARLSTMLYGAFALTSCIGIPYGIYALWSLSRPEAKRTLSE